MCRASTISNRRVSRASFSFLRSWGGNSQIFRPQGGMESPPSRGRASVANARSMTSLRPFSRFFCLAARPALSSFNLRKAVVRWQNRHGNEYAEPASPQSKIDHQDSPGSAPTSTSPSIHDTPHFYTDPYRPRLYRRLLLLHERFQAAEASPTSHLSGDSARSSDRAGNSPVEITSSKLF